MGGPESDREDADASQANPFRNAKAGDKFYAVSNAPEGRAMRIWNRVGVDDMVHFQIEDPDDHKILRGSIRNRDFVGEFAPMELQLKQGDTLEILEVGLKEEAKMGDLRIKYTFKDTNESKIYVVTMDSLRKCDAQWKKDRRGPDHLMGLERARQLLNDGPTIRSTDTVVDGIRLGALAQRVTSVLGRRYLT